jgi:tRNA threonylcarbamoyladenosine biosynthesis protein TsaB
MALILSLETSTTVCSVALHAEGKLVVDREVHIPQSHASKLALLVDEVVKLSGKKLNELNAVAIASGPGSYTGLRIGTSMAKGLCYSLNIPLISIGTLDVMASQVSHVNSQRSLLCPMIDARRMEVYCKVFAPDLSIKKEVSAMIIDETGFSDFLNRETMLFFGDGASKCRELIRHENAFFLEDIYPSAAELGYLAFNKLKGGITEDVVHFEPFYLKDFLIRKPG